MLGIFELHLEYPNSPLTLIARLVRQTKEEYVRKGAFFRIFPTEDTWDTYSQFLENKTHYNFMLHSQLYPNKSKEKGRPSSAVVTMNKFREMNQPTNMNLSVVPGSIQEKYSRYEKSLQPLGAVEDYPPEALADAITPDFSVIDDSITDTTRDDDSSSSSDIPTDDRPLADILYAIKRGCLRPLAFPECYHPCYTPPPGTPSYDRHTSVFKPIYSAFNPQTQAFELPLTRKERVSQYSHYVDLMNKYSTRMNLVDLRCNKSVLKLLPSRPKSGDKRPSTGQPPALPPTSPDAEKKAVTSDEKRGSDVDMQRKRKDDVREVDLKERERPGSLTLRSYIPDTAAGTRGKPGDKQPGQDGSRGTVPRKPEPPRGARKEHMIAKSYAANLPRGAGMSRVPRYRTISQTLAAGVHRPIPRPPKTDQHKPAAGVEVIKQCALDFGYKKIGPGEVMTYDQFLEEQRKAGKITSRSSSAQTLRSEFNDDIVVPVKAVKSTGKKKNSVVDKDQSQSAKKKKNAHGSKAKSNFSSLTSSRTSFSKSTSNSTVSLITSSKSIKSLQEKGGGVPEKQQLSENKGSEKEVEKKKVPDQKSPQNAVKKVTSQTSIIKDAKPVKTDEKLKPPVPSSIKKVTSQTSITNEKRKLRPNSAGSCMSTDSSPGKNQKKMESQENAVGSSKKNKGGEKTGVNVSVFTRDNITVSPKEVVVSRTVNKDMTTILVTVPHGSENLFTKTKIGKVEISLDSPTPEIVRFVSTDLQSASTKSSRKSSERTESSPKVGRRWSCASTMSEQSSSLSRSPAVTRRGHQAGGGAAGKSGGGRRNVEVVDAGYISCTSPLLTPPSPVSLLKKGGAPERKPEGKSDITRDKKSNKTSPYGPPNLVVQDKKPAVRSSSRPSAKVELVSEPSPYGASNLRYKVVEKESCDQVDGKSRGHGDAARSRSRVLSAREAARDASKVKVTRCVSNKVRGKSKKGDDQGTRSLPIICKRQKSGFESDLAQNRHRLLLGGGV